VVGRAAILAGFVLACGLCVSGTALADTAPSNAGEYLSIRIAGHITPKCEVERRDGPSQSFGQILDTRNGHAVPARLDLGFKLTCNAPYKAVLISKNGGLAYDGPTFAGFAKLIGYTAAINLDGRAGGLSLHCDSADMRAASAHGAGTVSDCKGESNGRDFSKGHGKVHLTLDGSSLPLLQGTYSDQLTLLVSPRC
jgi:hypothetical protein